MRKNIIEKYLAISLFITVSCAYANAQSISTPDIVKGNLTQTQILSDKSNVDSQSFIQENNSQNIDSIKEVQNTLKSLEDDWNNHDIDKVMNYYCDSYSNNDGLDKKAILELTKDFWNSYPDVKSSSKIFEIRVDGNYGIIESLDTSFGHTAKEMPCIGARGILSSHSEGAVYLKKIGDIWKITGDRNNFEEVKVTFGNEYKASFEAPSQVLSGAPFSAKISLEEKPKNVGVIASITSESLTYPQSTPHDCWRTISNSTLERIMSSNKDNKNELLMATIGYTDPVKGNIAGLSFITRRLNVIPCDRSKPVKSSENSIKDNTDSLKTNSSPIEQDNDVKPENPKKHHFNFLYKLFKLKQ